MDATAVAVAPDGSPPPLAAVVRMDPARGLQGKVKHLVITPTGLKSFSDAAGSPGVGILRAHRCGKLESDHYVHTDGVSASLALQDRRGGRQGRAGKCRSRIRLGETVGDCENRAPAPVGRVDLPHSRAAGPITRSPAAEARGWRLALIDRTKDAFASKAPEVSYHGGTGTGTGTGGGGERWLRRRRGTWRRDGARPACERGSLSVSSTRLEVPRGCSRHEGVSM